MNIQTVFESLINGQRQQMVSQIDEYGSDFWPDFRDYLAEHYSLDGTEPVELDPWKYFTDATVSYFRIKAR